MRTRLLPRRGGRASSAGKLLVRSVFFLLFVFRASAAPELGLKWQPGDATKTMGGYIERRLALSSNQPPSLKKLPTGLVAPVFGELKIGPREKPGARPLLIDEPPGGPSRFFLDGNGNGDFTDDPPVTWKQESVPGQGGVPISIYRGEGVVRIPFPSGDREGRLSFTRVARGSPVYQQVGHLLFYHREYLLQGQVLLGEKSYAAALVDELVTGDFRGTINNPQSGVFLFLDLNGDGRFDLQREILDVRMPFNVGGTTWEIANLTADGKFEFVRSSRSVPQMRVPPNLSRGGKAPSFTAPTTAGAPVKFPDDYRGKVVLLDFWATWCVPCLVELPNVVANYAKYHERGFEILGISLDQAESIPALPAFTRQNNMSWKQICDGKLWQSDIAVQYGVTSIPFMILVDGDTGEILGSMLEVRGGNLAPAIEAGLARKKQADK